MVVSSGQRVPYLYDAPLAVRARDGAWPGPVTPNIDVSGVTIEQAMFVYNAELRKWGGGFGSSFIYNLYSHPDIAPSGFEPKANGDTLTGLVGGVASIPSVDNIEQMRDNLRSLFREYADDSGYDRFDFLEAWLISAYPESPSGALVVVDLGFGSSFINRTFLRPAAEHVANGDFIDTDPHWLGGSGVFFDIDWGEVIFNPFPFPSVDYFFAPGADNFRLTFGPITPQFQTTTGNLPSVVVSRYNNDLNAFFGLNTNFDAIASGRVQIDGYVFGSGTIMELVSGNDNNYFPTLDGTTDFEDHIDGLRRVNTTGDNDPSARCYRTPTAQTSGLYRLATYNPRSAFPTTAIESGFVSFWPEGRVVLSDTGELISGNFIDGQQSSETSDGGLILSPALANGFHVFDDAIWITSDNTGGGSGNLNSRGLFVISPHNGSPVWYRPAETVVASNGNYGPGPGAFGAHVGLFKNGSDIVRLSRTLNQTLTSNVSGDEDLMEWTLYFQEYNQTTLNHTEIGTSYSVQSEDAILAGFAGTNNVTACVFDGINIYVSSIFGTVHKLDSSYNLVNLYRGDIAGRRHYANGQLLYTLAGQVSAGDPLLTAGSSSGIGVWSLTDPPGTSVESVGLVNHDSGKPLRGEAHFGYQSASDTRIHHIFDVTGSTHVRDGVWMLIQFDVSLYLCRIREDASEWIVLESIKFRDSLSQVTFGQVPSEFPIEGILHDID